MIASEIIESILESVVSVEKDIEAALQDFALLVIRGFETGPKSVLELGEHAHDDR